MINADPGLKRESHVVFANEDNSNPRQQKYCDAYINETEILKDVYSGRGNEEVRKRD